MNKQVRQPMIVLLSRDQKQNIGNHYLPIIKSIVVQQI
jgi:hypothetical protein